MNKNLKFKIAGGFLTATTIIITTPTQADSAKLINPNNGHAYQRFDTTLTWTNAKVACENRGAYLATVTSQAENDWIVQNHLNYS